MTRVLLALLLLGAAALPARAEEQRRTPKLKPEDHQTTPPDMDLIDIPTAAVLDYGAMTMRSRFGAGGNNLTHLGFGIVQRLQFGASLSTDKLIGTGSPILLNRPELQLKWRFYDGSRYLPAAALGFDGQGQFRDHDAKTYLEKERGFYIVGSQEVGVPGLMFHPGLNVSDFDTDAVFAFLGTSYNIDDKLLLMAEWDNIRHFSDSRFNVGVRFFVASFFDVGFALREIGQGGSYGNGASRGIERIAMLRYVGNF